MTRYSLPLVVVGLSLKELVTIVDFNREAPAIDTAAFPNTPAVAQEFFWASTPHPYYPGDAWAITFAYGHMHVYALDYIPTPTGYARCAR